jgi:hypothetical protein
MERREDKCNDFIHLIKQTGRGRGRGTGEEEGSREVDSLEIRGRFA